jgi:hypothetical protein
VVKVSAGEKLNEVKLEVQTPIVQIKHFDTLGLSLNIDLFLELCKHIDSDNIVGRARHQMQLCRCCDVVSGLHKFDFPALASMLSILPLSNKHRVSSQFVSKPVPSVRSPRQ